MPILDRFSLKGKVAVISGGAGLYGRQIMRAVAEAGARTFVASRDLAKLDEQAAILRKEGLDVTSLQFEYFGAASPPRHLGRRSAATTACIKRRGRLGEACPRWRRWEARSRRCPCPCSEMVRGVAPTRTDTTSISCAFDFASFFFRRLLKPSHNSHLYYCLSS